MTLSRAVSVSLILAALVLAVVYGALMLAPAAGTFHDDGIYLVTAQSLAEGRGYRLISVPGEPPQTKYPILFPWLVSLVWRMYPSFPANLPWLRVVPLGATLAWLWLSWRLLLHLGASRRAASVIVLLTAASPWVAFLSTATMSETLFAAFATAGLLVLVRSGAGLGSGTGFAAGAVAGASLLTRLAGVATAAGGLIALVVARRWKSAAQFAGGLVLVAGPWFGWVATQNSAAAAVDSYYSASPYGSWNIVASYAWLDKLVVLGLNTLYSVLGLGYFWGLQAPTWLSFPVGCAFAVTIVAGMWKERSNAAAIFLALYVAMLLAWVWPPMRFLVPVLPLLLWFAYSGAGKPGRLAGVVATFLVIAGTYQLFGLVASVRATGMVWPSTETAEDWNETSRLLDWVTRHTRRDAILTGNLDPAYFLFTGRKALRAFSPDSYLLYYNIRRRPENPLGTMTALRQRLLSMKADYLIMTPSGGFGEMPHLRALLAEIARDCAACLTPVAGAEGSGYVVYRINRDRLATPHADLLDEPNPPPGK